MLYHEESLGILKAMKSEELLKNKLRATKCNLNLLLRALEGKIEKALYNGSTKEKLKGKRMLMTFQAKFVNGRKLNHKNCDALFYHRLVKYLEKLEDFHGGLICDQAVRDMEQQQAYQQWQNQIPTVLASKDDQPDSTNGLNR